MALRALYLSAAAALSVVLAHCGAAQSLDSGACPCVSGYTCCAATSRCLRAGQLCTGAEAGSPAAAMDESGAPDAAATHDAGTGTRTLFGAHATIAGVTPDDQVVLVDDAQNVVEIPLAGGAITTILAHAPGGALKTYARVDGPFVMIWRGAGTWIGRLDVWTREGGLRAVSDQSNSFFAGQLPGTARAYYATNAANGSADLVVGDFNGGPSVRVGRYDISYNCLPITRAAIDRLYFGACPPDSTTASLTSATSAGVVTALGGILDSFSWSGSDNGERLWAIGPDSSLRWIDSAGQAHAIANDVSGAAITSSGDALVYVTRQGALVRAPLPSGPALTLESPGVTQVFDQASTGDVTSFARTVDPGGRGTDLFLASLTTPGTARLVAASTASSSSGFTLDGRYFLYLTKMDSSSSGEFHSVRADGTGDTVLSARNAGNVVPFGVSSILYFDNVSGDDATADLIVTDLSKAQRQPLAMAILQGSLRPLAGKGTVLFTRAGASAGVYAVSVPGL